MTRVKNLSQFKKWLAKDRKIEIIKNIHKPENENQIRKIKTVQTNSFTTLLDSGEESWIDIPKAKEMLFHKDNTIDFLDENNRIWLKIKLLVEEED